MKTADDRIILLGKVIAVILVLETVVHLFVRMLPLGRISGLVDSVLLAALISPVFYFWLTRECEEKAGWRESHRRAEDRFQALVTHASLGIYIIDGGAFAYVNPAFARVFGYGEAELIGKDPLALVADPCKARVSENIRLRQEGGKDTLDYSFTGKRKDGSPVEIEIKGSVVELDGRRVAIGTLADVTARKAAEEALRASEDRFRAVVDNLGVGVALVSPDMRILSMNKRMREWFPRIDPGAKPACYRSYNSPPREEVCSYCPVVKTLADGQPHESVTETPTPAGIVHYRILSSPITDGAGNVVAAIEMVQDITEQRRNDTSLKDALQRQARLNELLSLSVEASPLKEKLGRMLDCLVSTPWFAIERKGCVMLKEGASVRLAASVGLPAPARLAYAGMPPHGHLTLPLKAGDEVLGALSLYLKEGQSPDEGQREFARAAAGIFSGVVLMARSEDKFLQSQKMEAVGRLAGGVAHDFNNILTAIKGYAHFLRSGLPLEDRRRGDVEEITRAADRAADLTASLLSFSRRQVISPCVLDVNEVVKGMVKMLRCLLGESIDLSLNLDPALATVVADKGQLEQVLMNLTVNARDAMPRGGTLTIATATARGSSEELVELSVADTGTGIEPEVLAHIFEPFFSTKPQGKGTGLGLSTVFGIVKQAGGEVGVDTTVGNGSVFRVLLPACASPAEDAVPARTDSPPSGAETILVVEDEAPVRAVVERQLREAGYSVRTAATGEEALAVIERDGVDLLLTDVVLRGMNGPELVEKARAGRRGMKVLYMSGYTDGVVSEGGMLRKGVDLLAKPFSAEALALRVRAALDRAAS